MKIKSFKSLSFNIPFLFVISYTVIAIVIVFTVYFRFEHRMINDYTKMARGLTTLMANSYDTDLTEEYIEKNYNMPEYLELLKYYYNLKDNYPDVLYMYVYRFEKTDPALATVIIDLDEEYTDHPPQDSIDWIGETYTVDEPFASEMDTMLKGKDPVVHTVHTKDHQFLLSYVRPIVDKDGNYLCSACVDFSMDDVHSQDLMFLIGLMSVLGILMFMILWINIRIVQRKITRPLSKINRCIESFSYETESDRFENLNRLEELHLTQNDEIGSLFVSFVANMKESLYYMSNYNQAIGEIEYKNKELEDISKKTYKDPLTKVNNKAAYENDLATWNDEIQNGFNNIGVLLMDINNLKYVNDTFGHDKGDLYIQGCCKILCDTYKKSPVYRLGGDEFIVLLGEDDYADRDILFEKATAAYEASYLNQDAQPWERYSASIGMAILEPGDTLNNIVVRADKAMYENKVIFKNKYGTYR
ncbi:MAG: GGDEF domain-containing protein [Lachnospiraceae bacterium]|nr:GGDEF domain-containing protein [Lachnospiraceae bacterium]